VSNLIEEEVFRNCLKAEPKAQKDFYDFFSRTMYAVCLRYSNSNEDAKDIMQDGFVKVFTKLSQYSGKGSLEGWMKRIFINTALEHYRVNKVYMEQLDLDYSTSVPLNAFIIENISIKEIINLMNKLAPGFRTVLNMYVVEGYSHAEIAEMLGISEGTSKSQLSRARDAFAREYKKLEKGKISSKG